MVKFKVIRLQDFRELEATLNNFDAGVILDYQLTMPDYRVVILVLRYEDDPIRPDEPKDPKKAKDDKATE